MKEKLRTFAQSLGIEYIGIAPPGPYPEIEERLRQRISSGQYTGMEEQDTKKRVDPHLAMENVESVIVCLFPYLTDAPNGSNISKYTFLVDYHKVIKKKLEQISMFLESHIIGFEYKAFVDTGPLVERYLAYLAGLGYFGLNNQLITEKYGSYVFIGYILTNHSFEFDRPLDKKCLQCGACIRNCPGAALMEGYNMNPTYCASYITQKKEQLSDTEKEIIKKSKKVFGCDICQEVCPHNKAAEKT
ncbi:MAG: tRNA epoxyqueuosine(34) reductase QueG, partial [Clostridia bacterium]